MGFREVQTSPTRLNEDLTSSPPRRVSRVMANFILLRESNAPIRQRRSRLATRSPTRRARTTMIRYLAPTGGTTGSTNAERSRLKVMMISNRMETVVIPKMVGFFTAYPGTATGYELTYSRNGRFCSCR